MLSPLPLVSLSGVDRNDCHSPCFSVLCGLWIKMVFVQTALYINLSIGLPRGLFLLYCYRITRSGHDYMKLKSDNAPIRESIHPDSACRLSPIGPTKRLRAFLQSMFRRYRLPKTLRRATVVVLPKPNTPAEDPRSCRDCRPISAHCVPLNTV